MSKRLDRKQLLDLKRYAGSVFSVHDTIALLSVYTEGADYRDLHKAALLLNEAGNLLSRLAKHHLNAVGAQEAQ
jgi:hypothetical protein